MRVVAKAEPPRGLRRRLWRLPIGLYRVGLGPLLGRKFILLTHTGRVSGLPRQAVVEVVHRDARGLVAAAGFGRRSDWYRNVVANPRVTVGNGRLRAPAVAHPIDADEGAALMARYGMRHPRAARGLCRIMGFEVDGSEADFREVGRHIPFVRFVPADAEHRG